MGIKSKELERSDVLDRERDIDRKCIDEGRLDELWERYKKRAYGQAHSIMSRYTSTRNNGDYMSVAHMAFIKACSAWDCERGSFSTALILWVRSVSGGIFGYLGAKKRALEFPAFGPTDSNDSEDI